MARTAAGARDWQRWIARSAGGVALPLLSCLVTDHPQYGEPNVPAHLVRGAPVDFTRANNDMQQLCAGTGVSSERLWMAFQVLQVSDPNIDDNLEARIFVNGDWQSSNSVPITPTGKPERAPLVICAEHDAFNNNKKCNLVEVRVSRDFQIMEPGLPVESGDLAIVSWWIFDETSVETDVMPADCRDQAVMIEGGTR